MRKLAFAISFVLLVAFGLGLYLNQKAPAPVAQASLGSVTLAPQQPVQVTSTVSVNATATPTALMPAVTATAAATPTPGDQVIVIEPTMDPKLLADYKKIAVDVEPGTISFHPILKTIVQNMDYGQGVQISGSVLQGDLSDVPVLEGLGPPAQPGQYSYLTGYDWGSWSSMVGSTHYAVDLATSDLKLAAPTKGKIYAILVGSEAYVYGSGGVNVLTIAKIPDGHSSGKKGWLIFGNGHMKVEVPVKVGDIVNAGQYIGDIGLTGLTTGLHDHYYVVWLKEDGTTELVNPNDWGAIGKR